MMEPRTSDYTFEKVLGTGTFGKVCFVRRCSDGRPYVIKEQDISEQAKASYEMVLREIQCLRRMRHPHIIAYHDAWIEGHCCYIRMEYATRGTLKDMLNRQKKPLREEDSLYLFSQMILGVHHIHSQKILHRDLKPENILLTGRRGDIVKIGDFGVSKRIDEDLGKQHAGSYYYMAPEIFRDHLYSFKTDIWSLGTILYQMVTNNVPFEAWNYEEIFEAVCNGNIRPLDVDLSTEMFTLISKILQMNPERRPSIEKMLLCPYLIPYIIRVHLNVGRVEPGRSAVLETIEKDVLRSFEKTTE